MSKILGLAVFWSVAELVAAHLSPGTSVFVGWVVLIVVLAGLGSIVLSGILGGDGFDHLFAGFSLAFPGWVLTQFVFHWALVNPADACASTPNCGGGMILFSMVANLCIVAVGMACVAIPVFPVIWKLDKQK